MMVFMCSANQIASTNSPAAGSLICWFESRFIGLILILSTFSGCADLQPIIYTATQLPSEAADPSPVERLLIVSVDGLRPDVLLRANGPAMRQLMEIGSFSFYAKTTAIAWTLPSHASMLTGEPPREHGFIWDDDVPKEKRIYSRRPTLFEMAKARGYTTAMSCGKSKLNQLAKPGTLDWEYITEEYAEAHQVAARAAEIIRQHKPDVFFLHFADVDGTGHGNGWGSKGQLDAVGKVDAALGSVLDVYRQLNLFEKTAIILTADHGGSGTVHGAGDVRSQLIPWIISGPGVRQNLDLTGYHELEIHTEDTFATACMLLRIPIEGKITGKPILQVFKNQEARFPLDYLKSAATRPAVE
jgi:arylsulfatase A-like enzyme